MTRKPGKRCVISGGIRLVRLRARRNQVQIGVDRSCEMVMHRTEVLERIQDDAAPELVNE